MEFGSSTSMTSVWGVVLIRFLTVRLKCFSSTIVWNLEMQGKLYISLDSWVKYLSEAAL